MGSPRLPAPSTGLVGRAPELERLQKLLDSGSVLTLAGLGGVGKTRLALECAHAFAARNRRVTWVDLSAATGDSTIRAQIARALDMGNVPPESFVREVAGRTDLIVLDRCEDVAAPVSRLAHRFMEGAQGLAIVATSRTAIDGVPVMNVEPLALEGDGDAGPDAIRLFTERAVAANAQFHLDARALKNVRKICVLLGGIPLAIEIAASYAPYIDVADLADRLGDGRLGDVSGPVSTILTWSYAHLDEDARSVLRAVSLYEGPFRFVDAEAAAALPALRRSLERLTAASLLSAAVSDGLARFRLADPVREFARARLDEAGETQDALARIAASLSRSAEELDRRIAVGDSAALAALPGTFAPAASVLKRAPEFGSGILPDACRLAGSLAPHLIRIGYQAELREPLARLVDAAARAEADLGEPYDRLLEAAAFLANRMGELDAAVALNDKRIERARAAGSADGLAHAIATSMQAVLHSSRTERANAFAAELAELVPAVRDRGLLARVYRGLGQIAFVSKRFEDSKRFYEAFLDLGPDAAPKSTHTIVLHDYGASLAYLGDIDAGISYIDACIDAAIGSDPSTAAHGLASKAYWYLERERCEEAQAALRRAIELFARGINVVTQYYILEMYVAASLRDEQAETLCRVLGFVERGRERLGFKPSPAEAPRIAATTAAVRSRVDGSAGRRAFAAGRLASFEDTIARIATLKPGVVSVKRFERFAGLSSREREIAERVAAGKTNRQIAADLVVSVRTVDHHVASIFRKLGIQKREELE